VYNATRQVGSVLGSASMAAFMTTRISAEMPLAADGPGGEGSVTELPDFLHAPFASAMSQSLLLPAFVALFGVVAAMFLLGFASPAAPALQRPDPTDDDHWDDDHDIDDDDYVEFTVAHPEPPPVAAPTSAAPVVSVAPAAPADVIRVEEEGVTEPIAVPVNTWHQEQPEPAPAPPVENPQSPGHRREPARSLLDFLADPPGAKSSVEPIGFVHNGFHVDEEERYQPLDLAGDGHYESLNEAGTDPSSSSRHGLVDDAPRSNGRHSRADTGNSSSRGRHSRPAD
jgi:hypothetical protein